MGREGGSWSFGFGGLTRNSCSFASLLVTGVGVIVGDRVFIQEGVVWMHMAFLAFVWKWMMYCEDMSMRTLTSFASHLTEEELPFEHLEIVPLFCYFQ